jgi:hypothetical protein
VCELTREILEGIMRVELDKERRIVADPDGDHPVCKPALCTSVCERCGQDVRTAQGACPAVKPEHRWRIKDES